MAQKNLVGDDYYTIVYCDSMVCRVNTFEKGNHGKCPACGQVGLPL